ncbi:hypothetical protein D3C87_1133460 [compost metagenome]
MVDETEMILVWVWYNGKDTKDHNPRYPGRVLYYWPNHETTEHWHCIRTDLDKHPMCKEIGALADLAGPDANYPDKCVSDDFTIPKEWWGNPALIEHKD